VAAGGIAESKKRQKQTNRLSDKSSTAPTWNHSLNILKEAVNVNETNINYALLMHSCILLSMAPYNLHKDTGTTAVNTQMIKQVRFSLIYDKCIFLIFSS
jgi:hypothetical protein